MALLEYNLDPRFPLYILTLAFETKPFENLLEHHSRQFFTWFWSLV